ncbi:hypothetical protein PTSG_00843 [Salpingoeca rosetta]|uniref:Uncharacterized protein n=1 Tax=Salpingoeca rosetta (strain ATCC 50818 / BSB-021) TaxID=946362 RepID=F2TXM7_SALR5|nr:uncharacterized protein PTSG_00843 [Salpingoeca rosetta]EGD76136.1 hypothetical protein PTSG_00843 [Salpingoeca rosetta]|eukprot:XP_004998311.1 hypothetical protein PTSG_00843 [Salpingoeca rosetta]
MDANPSTDDDGFWDEEAIVHQTADYLQAMMQHNTYFPPETKEDPRLFHNFYLTRPVPISLRDYIIRMWRLAKVGTEAVLCIPSYIRALYQTHNMVFSDKLAHRIVATCLLIAMKMCNDVLYTNRRYSKIAGLSAGTMLLLELEMLKLLEKNACLPPAQLVSDRRHLQRFVAGEVAAWEQPPEVDPSSWVRVGRVERLALEATEVLNRLCSEDEEEDGGDDGSGVDGGDDGEYVDGDDGGGGDDDDQQKQKLEKERGVSGGDGSNNVEREMNGEGARSSGGGGGGGGGSDGDDVRGAHAPQHDTDSANQQHQHQHQHQSNHDAQHA